MKYLLTPAAMLILSWSIPSYSEPSVSRGLMLKMHGLEVDAKRAFIDLLYNDMPTKKIRRTPTKKISYFCLVSELGFIASFNNFICCWSVYALNRLRGLIIWPTCLAY